MLTALIAKLGSWLDGRTDREKLLLAAVSCLALLWVAVAGVWQPLEARREALLGTIAQQDRALAVLAASPAPAAVAVAASADSRPLNVVVTDSAAALAIGLRRLEPEGARVRAVLEDAPFDTVLLWLDALEREHGLRLTALDLTRRPAPGVVGASLTLER